MGSHNYCRNPTRHKRDDGPWCYVADSTVKWEYCVVPACGHYMYLEASNMRAGQQITMETPKLLTSGPDCAFEFWYHMRGDGIGQLFVAVNSSRGYIREEISKPDSVDWYKYTVPLGAISDFTVALTGVRGDNYRGDIAIDDATFVGCAPTGAASAPKILYSSPDLVLTEMDHDFRLDCKMSGNLAPDITWWHNGEPILLDQRRRMLINGSLAVTHIGSYDTGTYMCHGINQVASVNATMKVCSAPFARFSTTSLSLTPFPYQVTVPASADSCDFETDKCIWRDGINNTDFFWTWQQGCTPSYSTGPCTDHTTGTDQGHFMYVEASWPRNENDKAELQSEWLSTKDVSVCVGSAVERV